MQGCGGWGLEEAGEDHHPPASPLQPCQVRSPPQPGAGRAGSDGAGRRGMSSRPGCVVPCAAAAPERRRRGTSRGNLGLVSGSEGGGRLLRSAGRGAAIGSPAVNPHPAPEVGPCDPPGGRAGARPPGRRRGAQEPSARRTRVGTPHGAALRISPPGGGGVPRRAGSRRLPVRGGSSSTRTPPPPPVPCAAPRRPPQAAELGGERGPAGVVAMTSACAAGRRR